jgi:hypothetical protein
MFYFECAGLNSCARSQQFINRFFSYRTCCQMFKKVNSVSPSYLNDRIQVGHSLRTRVFHIPHHSLASTAHLFFVCDPAMWNTLPISVWTESWERKFRAVCWEFLKFTTLPIFAYHHLFLLTHLFLSLSSPICFAKNVSLFLATKPLPARCFLYNIIIFVIRIQFLFIHINFNAQKWKDSMSTIGFCILYTE